jgi:hypothetical protein
MSRSAQISWGSADGDHETSGKSSAPAGVHKIKLGQPFASGRNSNPILVPMNPSAVRPPQDSQTLEAWFKKKIFSYQIDMRIDRVGDRLIEEGTLRNVGNLYRNAWREDSAGRNRGRGMNNWVISPLSPNEKIVPGRCRTSLIGSARDPVRSHRPAWALPSATRHGGAAYRCSRSDQGEGDERRQADGK